MDFITFKDISDSKGRIQNGLLCETILQRYDIKSCNNTLYIGQPYEGYYQRIDNDLLFIYSLLNTECQNTLSTNNAQEVVNRLKNSPRTAFKMTNFNTDANLINLNNGVLNIQSMNILPPSLKYNFINRVDFSFIANVSIEQAPNFKQFCATSLGNDKKKITRFLQIVAYIISNDFSAKKAFIFYGEPHSGKSVVFRLIIRIFGDSNISTLSLRQLGTRFAGGKLSQSRLNVNGDIDSDVVKDISIFKQIVGNDNITGEFKMKDTFDFQPRVHMLFGCNTLPHIRDIHGIQAFIDRICLLHFPQSILPEYWDTALYEKLYEERDMIFSLAMNELNKLKKNNFIFALDEDSEDAFQAYIDQLNPVDAFIRKKCIVHQEARIYKSTFIAALRKWCNDYGFDMQMTDTQISRTVIRCGSIRSSKIRIDGGKPLASFIGIKLKDEE